MTTNRQGWPEADKEGQKSRTWPKVANSGQTWPRFPVTPSHAVSFHKCLPPTWEVHHSTVQGKICLAPKEFFDQKIAGRCSEGGRTPPTSMGWEGVRLPTPTFHKVSRIPVQSWGELNTPNPFPEPQRCHSGRHAVEVSLSPCILHIL